MDDLARDGQIHVRSLFWCCPGKPVSYQVAVPSLAQAEGGPPALGARQFRPNYKPHSPAVSFMGTGVQDRNNRDCLDLSVGRVHIVLYTASSCGSSVRILQLRIV